MKTKNNHSIYSRQQTRGKFRRFHGFVLRTFCQRENKVSEVEDDKEIFKNELVIEVDQNKKSIFNTYL